MKKYARKCDVCGGVFNKGYCINGGENYYCTRECLLKEMTWKEFLELYDDGEGDSYWTTWEDPDDMQYYADGSEIDDE